MATIRSRQLQSWHIPPKSGRWQWWPHHTAPLYDLSSSYSGSQGQLSGRVSLLRDHHNKQIHQTNKFPPHQSPNNCQRWQFGWFWYRTKRFFMKHFWASRFYPSQPSFLISGSGPPVFVPRKKKGIHNQKGRIIINHNSMKCALRYYAFIGSYLICAQETLLESVNFS